MKRLLFAAASVAILAGCGGAESQRPASGRDAGELRIEEVHVAGAPFAIEGELTYYSVERNGDEVASGRLDPTAGASVRLDGGRYALDVWHRVCDGNCGTLDPPSDRCEQAVELEAKGTALATVRNRPGSACTIATGRVGIAYARAVRLSGSEASIWVADADGSRPVRLTTGSWYTPPELSPDGTQVAFVRTRTAPRRSELWVIPAGGGEPRPLRRFTGPRAFIWELAWSPDSARLAIGQDPGLMLVDVATGKTRLFARGGRTVGVSAPTFSPDGAAIAYDRSTRTGVDVYVSDGRAARPMTHDHRSLAPVWGPQRLAFARVSRRRGDIWTVSHPGAKPKRLTRTGAQIEPVAWSADGRRLLAANPAMHNGRLWAVDVPSGRARALTGWVGDLFAQGLSRDGETILAAIGCGGRASPLGMVETLPFAGGKPHVIVDGPCRASWNA